MYPKHSFAAVLGTAMLALSTGALAGPAPAPTDEAANGALPLPEQLADPVQLDSARGGSSSANATLAGTVSDNAATQVTTGNNLIQSGSLAGSTGLPVVIQNSGANVLIQSATTINLELK